jgi:hypothetical protein
MSHLIRFLLLSLAIACALPLVYAQVSVEPEMKQGHHSFSGEVLPRSRVGPTTVPISFRKPDGLILSQANLYFTSHDSSGAAVWRTAQNSSPGQEGVLYWEQGARFGDIVFAKVDGSFFGYFFSKKAGVITIKRVPLAGGTTTTLATVTDVDVEESHRNLVTDGVSLFWQDRRAVRKMPIRGGAVAVLDRTRLNEHSAGIALQLENLIYASEDKIHFVPKSGAATTDPSVRIIATALSRVTALHLGFGDVYWGEQSGAVRRKRGSTITALPHTTNLIPSSISRNGALQEAWTSCDSQSCTLRIEFVSISGPSMPIGAGALGVTVISSGDVFWGDAAGVHRTN